MANITKKVSRFINAIVTWNTAVDQNDTPATIAAGDVFRIEESLGKSAGKVIIVAAANITIRVNSYYKVYPNRNSQEFFNAEWSSNLALGAETHDTSATTIAIAGSTTYTLEGVGPIRNIELVSTSGNFTLQAQ